MTERIEFGSKSAADAFRNEHEGHLGSHDDRRLKTVAISSSAPDWVLEEATIEAASGRSDRGSRGGQVKLTDHERESIDFTRTSIPHARSVKGLMIETGVDDWLAYYDHTLSVDEHREVAERATRDERGARMDAGADVDERLAAAEGARGEQCEQARDYCEDEGDDDACQFLQEACGFDEDDIQTLLEAEPSDLSGEIYGALRRLWLRYQIAVADAKEAAAAINEIHRESGRDFVSFEELGDRQLTEEDIDW
ncbi:hypothetical protein [Natronosalvus halobius]|uniref:hypothetical protein n=1 Tax=Natronosalvus halobius TaxID=2953746 RepID=UPI0020A09503|nr:hypothetical protein [Natronosalvus halobius]USZ73248.1 hypothetical protein NGM15_08110 [Natronosalvus halobius]